MEHSFTTEALMEDSRQPIPGASAPATPDQVSSEAYRRARRKVSMLRGWYIHAFVYACVIAMLWLIYATTGHARYPWPLPATLGWGLGLAIHGLVVWLGTSRRGRGWEERKIEQYINEEMTGRSSGRR
jgi:hypothetical protein